MMPQLFDWQVQEEDDSPIGAPEERSSRQLYRWRLFGGLLLLLLVAALLLFRWRISERQALMEKDLRAFIRHEEQQRLFGLTEGADKLMVPDTPEAWQEGYLSSFAEADDVEPVDLSVEEIQLDGTEALVTVRLDNVVQMRFYRLIGQRWRRAPLSEALWGEPRQIELADIGLTIAYRARDEAFVERLVADLPALLGEGSAWPKIESNIITVFPHEFGSPLLWHEMNEVIINSPQVVMAEGLDGEAAVRLALADEFLAKMSSERAANNARLSDIQAFQAAIRTIFVLRWALPSEVIPRQEWQMATTAASKSPLLGDWEINRQAASLETVWKPHFSEATFLLVADYLYDEIGTEGLQRVLKELPTVQSWDSLFYPLTGRYTIELEDELLGNSTTKRVADNVPQLPFSVTLLGMDSEKRVLEVKVADQEQPLSIQTAGATLVGAEGAILNDQCAMLHQELTITQGDWLKVGQELQARQLLISDASPSTSLPTSTTLAPPDTMAYLAERRDGAQRGRGFGSFLALSEDGTATHLTSLPPLMSLAVQMQPSIPWPPRFLLTLTVPKCEQTWLFMYDPQQGIIQRWLASSNERIFTSFVWRPLEEEFILTGPIPNQDVRASLKKVHYWSASAEKPLRLLHEIPSAHYPLAWRGENVFTLDEERGAIKLIEQKSGEVVKRIALAGEDVRFTMLSEDSKYFFYDVQPPQIQPITLKADDLLDADSFLPPHKQTIHVVELESGQDTLLFSASEGEWLWPIGGGSATNRLLLLSAPEAPEQSMPTHLLLLDLKAPEQPTIYEIPADEYVTSALACENDHVLMTIYSPNSHSNTEVRVSQPDGTTKSLLRSDKELQLLSCR